MHNTIERLGLQSETFQESFNILSCAANLEELAKNFFHILRGNLQILYAVIFFKGKETAEWQILFSKAKSETDHQDMLSLSNKSGISYIDHAEFKVSINQPLFNKKTFKILLGAKLDKSVFNEYDKIVLQFYLQQLSSAYQFYTVRQKERQLIFDLNHRVVQLNSLINMGIELSRLQEESELLILSLERILALTNASKGVIRIKIGNEIHNIFYPFKFKFNDLKKSTFQISAKFGFAKKEYHFFLFEKESRKGLVHFDDLDQILLEAVVRQIRVSLENQYLYEQSLEKERVNKEIALAGEIQKKIIPQKLPEINGFDVSGINIPTKFIGGDYYDCISLKDGRYLFIMADVSGKGVSAGLLVSTLHASAHAYVDSPFELVALVQKLNKVICDAATDEKFITGVFALLQPENNEFYAVSAGHNPTYILRNDKTLEEVKIGGIPLGIMPMPFEYELSNFTLYPGDRVFFYTDGVTEAMNELNEEYDIKRPIKNFLIENKDLSAQNFIENLVNDLKEFTGSTPQNDDITALSLVKK